MKDMSEKERAEAIKAHGEAHSAKILARRKARISADDRKKKRGLDAFIDRLMIPK